MFHCCRAAQVLLNESRCWNVVLLVNARDLPAFRSTLSVADLADSWSFSG